MWDSHGVFVLVAGELRGRKYRGEDRQVFALFSLPASRKVDGASRKEQRCQKTTSVFPLRSKRELRDQSQLGISLHGGFQNKENLTVSEAQGITVLTMALWV